MAKRREVAKPQVKKVWLVGTASSGVHAPYDDPSWEIRGVSARASYVTRAERWYELHRLDGEPPAWADNWRKTLTAFMRDIPELVMIYPEPDLAPGKVRQYPVERIIKRFGTYFMTSTFAWMMAEAIDEMVPDGTVAAPGTCEIGFCGVDMEAGTEYEEQRAGFHHLIRVAYLLGINITRLATGGLSYEPVPYPMWQDDPLLQKATLRSREHRDKLATFEDSMRLTRGMIASTKGSLQEIAMMAREGYDPKARAKEMSKQLDNLMNTSSDLSRNIVDAEARWAEQQWLLAQLRP